MGLAPQAAPRPARRSRKIDAKGRAYATGKRKNAVARVWIKRGGGKITVNGKDVDDLFRASGPADADRAAAARRQTGWTQFDVDCTVVRRRPVGPGGRGAPWYCRRR